MPTRRSSVRVIGLVVLAAAIVGAGFLLDPAARSWADGWHRQSLLAGSLRSLLMPLGKADLQLTVVLALGAAGLRRRATAALLAVLLAGLAVAVVKPAVGRARPGGKAGSFPSGDVASAAAAATPLVAAAPALWPVAGALVGGVAAFRVLDHQHHLSDATAGLVLGVATGLAGLAVARRLRRVPGSRLFAWGTALGVAVLLRGVVFDWSERHLTGLAVILPPLLLVVAVRFAAARWRRTDRGSWTKRPRAVSAVAVVVLALCWSIAAGSTLWDRDEPRFARASEEMLESGNWMVPTFNGRLRPDKPVGIYWLMAPSIRAFGDSEWAVRMWSGVGLAASVLLIGGFLRRHAPGADPLVAVVVVGLSPLAMVVGTVATTDGVLLALVTASMVVLGEGLLGTWTVGRTALLGVLLGAGLLVKGPVALVFPGLAAVGWVVLGLRERDRRWRVDAAAFAGAAALGCALFLAWGLPANAASGGELARVGLGHHVLERMRRPLESHGGGSVAYALYYPLVLLAGMLPFSALLPGGVMALWRGLVGSKPLRRFLALWILPPVVLFTLVATKLPHYILPVVPGLAVVVALGVAAAERDPGFAAGRAWRLGRWWLVLSGLVVAMALVGGAWLGPLSGLRRFGVGLAATVVTAAVIGWRLESRGRHRLTVLALGRAAVVAFLQVRAALPVVERVKPAPVVARAVRDATPPSAPVAAVGFTEPSLAFYLGRSFVELSPAGVGPWLAGNPGGVLIADTGALGGQTLPDCEEIVRFDGINVANGRRVEVVALRSRVPPPDAAQSAAQ